MREHIEPLHVVVPDQLIDRTRQRPMTFFDTPGLVVHVGMGEPFSASLSAVLAEAAETEGAHVHRGGTYVCIEGPQFSTRAESETFRSWGVDVIGMTALPEARLAREAEICYALLAMVTDYDVWHESEEDVSAEMVIANLMANTSLSQRVVRRVVGRAFQRRRLRLRMRRCPGHCHHHRARDDFARACFSARSAWLADT